MPRGQWFSEVDESVSVRCDRVLQWLEWLVAAGDLASQLALKCRSDLTGWGLPTASPMFKTRWLRLASQTSNIEEALRAYELTGDDFPFLPEDVLNYVGLRFRLGMLEPEDLVPLRGRSTTVRMSLHSTCSVNVILN